MSWPGKIMQLFWILMPMYTVMAAHIVNRKAVLGAQVDSRRKRHRDFCEFGTRQAQVERSDFFRGNRDPHFPVFRKDTDGELTQSELSGVVQLALRWYGETVACELLASEASNGLCLEAASQGADVLMMCVYWTDHPKPKGSICKKLIGA